ncbi:MAG: YCF48-related protein, partial [Ignavibacteria bacterium]
NCLILKANYGGLNWTQYPVVIPGKLNSVYFINQFTGFAVGNAGKYIKTTNEGTNWSVSTLSSYDLKSIFFPDSLNGWIVGSSGTVINTTNGGNNWIAKNGIYGSHTSVHFSNVQTGWIATNLGYIYQTTNGGSTIGIQQISSEIPKEYKISQNYPNPFNPSTTIRLELPKKEYVNLTVYNVNGIEIERLINGVKNAGSYEISFDGSNISSGIYYYRLMTVKFTDTKKMILIK